MPETTARGDGRRDGSDEAKQSEDQDPKQRKPESQPPREKAVIPGVRSLSTPPGEPYNDPEYGRS